LKAGIIRHPGTLINSRLFAVCVMCLILFAVNPNDQHRLVVAANRDELYARPTTDANYWEDHPDILAGRDEDAGGTWLGVNRQGGFAAVTNFREEPPQPLPPRSRGDLPTRFLKDRPNPADYAKQINEQGHQFKGFNLLIADHTNCYYYGNRAGAPKALSDGYYGLSNQLLDCDWPKVIEGREKLGASIQSGDYAPDVLFELLLDHGDKRDFSNSFIAADRYGTRAATVVLIDHDGSVYFEERNFGESGTQLASNVFVY
jgi:uncharacterized protein with NRDE domain